MSHKNSDTIIQHTLWVWVVVFHAFSESDHSFYEWDMMMTMTIFQHTNLNFEQTILKPTTNH